MPIITLTTEWNKNDYYIGSVKGAILGDCPDAVIIDISHQVTTYSIAQSAFLVRSCYKNFPDGTIHIIGVKSESKNKYPYIAVKHKEQYFIAANNGIISLILNDKPQIITSIDIFGEYSTFPELNIFTKAACHLAKGNNISQLGEEVQTPEKHIAFLPAIDESVISGSIIYIDSYKNAITNITETLFNEIGKNRPFEIFMQSSYYKTTKISKKYNEVGDSDLVTIFNSLGLLEVAMNNAPVCELLNLEINSSIRVKFNPSNSQILNFKS